MLTLPVLPRSFFRHYLTLPPWSRTRPLPLLDTVLNLPMNRVSPADQTLLVEFATGGWSTVRPLRRLRHCGFSAIC